MASSGVHLKDQFLQEQGLVLEASLFTCVIWSLTDSLFLWGHYFGCISEVLIL